MVLKTVNFDVVKGVLILLFLQFSGLVAGQSPNQYILILGVTQDGGYPHIGCDKWCCNNKKIDSAKIYVASLALIDSEQKKWWLFEATPDITAQLDLLQQLTNKQFNYLPDGILLTHAHIGHYTGLMYLGREALGANNVPVYVLPKMEQFIRNNGPWSQLVNLGNIELKVLQPGQGYSLSKTVSIEPFLVPHRDEFSETAGYQIQTLNKKYLFIPDVDKWSKWKRNLVEEIRKVDVAFIDASFYSGNELPGRDMNEIPHPLVTETVKLFTDSSDKSKIVFIHFNHTNPLLWDRNKQKEFLQSGFKLGIQGATY
jgi:pyrroloquinoline quinone biosynthesis protein B